MVLVSFQSQFQSILGFDFNFRFGSFLSFFPSKFYYLSITCNLQSAFDIFNRSIYPHHPFVLLFFFILINPLLSCHLDPPFRHSLLHFDPLPIHLLLVTMCRSLQPCCNMTFYMCPNQPNSNFYLIWCCKVQVYIFVPNDELRNQLQSCDGVCPLLL